MQKLPKLIFRISIILIVLIAALSAIGHFLPLEVSNDSIQNDYEQIRFYVLPILVLLTLFGTVKKRSDILINAFKVLATVIASLVCVFVLVASAFDGMCRWSDSEVLFQNRIDQDERIVLREFGCGATDSGSPTYKICKVKTIVPGLNWISDVDTTQLDKMIWRPTQRQERTANMALPK